ncbi:unnamed protein product, partial [Ectocarpus sp. 4 AP-2014]
HSKANTVGRGAQSRAYLSLKGVTCMNTDIQWGSPNKVVARQPIMTAFAWGGRLVQCVEHQVFYLMPANFTLLMQSGRHIQTAIYGDPRCCSLYTHTHLYRYNLVE